MPKKKSTSPEPATEAKKLKKKDDRSLLNQIFQDEKLKTNVTLAIRYVLFLEQSYHMVNATLV